MYGLCAYSQTVIKNVYDFPVKPGMEKIIDELSYQLIKQE
jgi:hypothetical protein